MPPDFQKASAENAVKSGKETLCMAGAPPESEQKPPPAEPPSLAGCWLTAHVESSAESEREFVQADILDRGPDNRQATVLGREDVDLISPLPHIAEETFNGISGLNVAMHRLRKRIKRQEVLFILSQASHRLWIALAVFGFEGSELDHGLLLCRLIPNPNEFGLDVSTFSSRDSIEHIALFMHQTALTRGRRKHVRDRREQSVMSIGHDQIDVGGSSCPQILQEASPSLFVLLCAGAQC